MDKECEEIVVRAFFLRRRQERTLFELASSKKRKDAISRLCHNSQETLDKKYMIEIALPDSDFTEILNQLKKYGAGEKSYCISYNSEIDGKYLPLEIAIEKAVGFGMASIVSCIHGKLAYLEEEQCFGPPRRFILKKD